MEDRANSSGLSQDEVAVRSGLSKNYISLVELKTKSPTFETLLRISKALGTRPSVPAAKAETDAAHFARLKGGK